MNNMRRFLFITVFLMLTVLVGAENMLYETQDTPNKVYLLGSIHLMPEDAYPLDSALDTAFDESDVLVVELDASQIDQAELQTFLAQKAFLPIETQLSDLLAPKVFRSLTEKLEAIGIPQAQMNRFRPWFASMSLSAGILVKLGLKPELGIDMHFLNKAHQKNMEILELETMMLQMEKLSSLPDSVQVDYLNYSIDDFDKIEDVFKELIQAWEIGDAKKLDELSRGKMKEEAEELPGIMLYYDKLFTEREGGMVDQIMQYANGDEKHTYFVIVGSFHLVGDDGIIQRLKDNGINTIQR